MAILDPLIEGHDHVATAGRDLHLEAEVLFVRIDQVTGAGDLDPGQAVEDQVSGQCQMNAFQALHGVAALGDHGTGIEGRGGRLLRREYGVDGAALPHEQAGNDGDSNRYEPGHRARNDTPEPSLQGKARPAGRRGWRWIRRGGRESGTPAGLASSGIIATQSRRDTAYTRLSPSCYMLAR